VTPQPSTAGELCFVEYLKLRALSYIFEPRLDGKKRPDFLVRRAGADVLCEIKDLNHNPPETRELRRLLTGGEVPEPEMESIPWDRVRERISQGAKKLREYKRRWPCVVVLFNTTATVFLDEFLVRGAMLGDQAIEVLFPKPDQEEPIQFSARIAYDNRTRILRANLNTTISAVALLEHVEPNRGSLADALEAANTKGTAAAIEFALRFSAQHPEVDHREPRLRIIRNEHALISLPDGVFNGPHDLVS
jgi:hypothetical protein